MKEIVKIKRLFTVQARNFLDGKNKILRIALCLFKFKATYNNNYSLLAWEPSAAQVTKSYYRRLPALKRF